MESELLQVNYELPKIFVLDRTREEHWSYAGRMWARIWKFAKDYCPDTQPDILVDDVMREFVKLHPAYLILGYRNDEYDLVGHLLACVSVPGWSQKRRCLILQYELDEGLSMGLLQAAFDKYIVDWAKTEYCCEIIAYTKTEAAKRAFQVFHGFELDLIQVRRGL